MIGVKKLLAPFTLRGQKTRDVDASCAMRGLALASALRHRHDLLCIVCHTGETKDPFDADHQRPLVRNAG